MDTSKGLLLRNLILHGYRKDYRVTFNPGVNVIYGDADTGKSSILRLVYYLLGGKAITLDEEISSSVKFAILELQINGAPYCISRDLYNPARDVEVYSCDYNDITNSFPEKYRSSVPKGDSENKSLSDFLLDAIGLPFVRLKQAPTKDSSETARLSFLDLFKFMYLDQDDVGSTRMLNIGNPVVETKNREVLKYIFSVLDSSVSELDADISAKTNEKKQLINQYSTVSSFLSQTEFKSIQDLDQEITNIDELKEEIEDQLADLNARMTSDNEIYDGWKDALHTINLNISEFDDKKNTALRNIERFTRLQNDYQNDIDKIKSGLKARDVLGKEIKEQTNCPVCETVVDLSSITEKFDIASDSRLNGELTSITRRTKDLKVLIDENRKELEDANSILEKLHEEKAKVRVIIDEELESAISPYIAERDAIVKELAQLGERRERAVHSLRVRNKQSEIAEKIGRLESVIEKLKFNLEELKEKAPSVDDVLTDLSQDLDSFIQSVKIKNHHGVGIDDRSYLPQVRNIEYRKINSGGLRTITSIGFLTSILSQKLRKDTNIPGLLMIDTVGKFLGKTPEDSEGLQLDSVDDVDGVADPEKYKNLFEALLNTAEEFEAQNKLCQIILVDNDMPQDVAYETKGFEIAHYRSNGMNGLPIGLIDDWDSVSKGSLSSEKEELEGNSDLIVRPIKELSLEYTVETLKQKYGPDLSGVDSIPYVETITEAIEDSYTHTKRIKNSDQYGKIDYRIKPGAINSGLTLSSSIRSSDVPQEFYSALGRGFSEIMGEGLIPGLPLLDIEVELLGCSYHDKDSTPEVFEIIAEEALRQSIPKAGEQLLEPIMHVKVFTPESSAGDIVGDLNRRRGKINHQEIDTAGVHIEAEVPLTEMYSYIDSLRAITSGQGKFSMEFSHFGVCPQNVAEEVLAKAKGESNWEA